MWGWGHQRQDGPQLLFGNSQSCLQGVRSEVCHSEMWYDRSLDSAGPGGSEVAHFVTRCSHEQDSRRRTLSQNQIQIRAETGLGSDSVVRRKKGFC